MQSNLYEESGQKLLENFGELDSEWLWLWRHQYKNCSQKSKALGADLFNRNAKQSRPVVEKRV